MVSPSESSQGIMSHNMQLITQDIPLDRSRRLLNYGNLVVFGNVVSVNMDIIFADSEYVYIRVCYSHDFVNNTVHIELDLHLQSQ